MKKTNLKSEVADEVEKFIERIEKKYKILLRFNFEIKDEKKHKPKKNTKTAR
jgi:hypothetical protein